MNADARVALKTVPGGRKLTPEQRASAEDAVAKLRRRVVGVAKIDFFGAARRDVTRAAVDDLEAKLCPQAEQPSAPTQALEKDRPRGRTWVTRQDIFVDRIASAWLIRRFIDPEAHFRFVAPQGYRPKRGELRFDMFEGEYTHEGDRCTFETLLRRFELDDPALTGIAELVHDIDLSDGKFGREDAMGIKRVLAGIAAACPNDDSRFERGGALFDDLYALAAKELKCDSELLVR